MKRRHPRPRLRNLAIVSSLASLTLIAAHPAFGQKPDGKKTPPIPEATTDAAHDYPNDVVRAVMGNTMITLYHELAHGLVDIYALPMLGREEDAADAFALVELITQIRSPESDAATDAVLAEYGKATARAWYHSAQEDGAPSQGAYFGPHALNKQRMFQTVCLLMGGEPELFAGLSDQLDISEFYLMDCARQFRDAYDGWVYTLDTFGAFHSSDDGRETPDLTFVFAPPEDEAHVRWAELAENWAYLDEVQRHFSSSFDMDTPIEVRFETCREENAYYYPGESRVTMCYDLMEAYARYARRPISPPAASTIGDTLEQILDEITPPETQ